MIPPLFIFSVIGPHFSLINKVQHLYVVNPYRNTALKYIFLIILHLISFK